MNNKDKALRCAYQVLRVIALGGHIDPAMAKTVSDLCALALPMKYRFTRDELDYIALVAKNTGGQYAPVGTKN
jgi:hypothetical protein